MLGCCLLLPAAAAVCVLLRQSPLSCASFNCPPPTEDKTAQTGPTLSADLCCVSEASNTFAVDRMVFNCVSECCTAAGNSKPLLQQPCLAYLCAQYQAYDQIAKIPDNAWAIRWQCELCTYCLHHKTCRRRRSGCRQLATQNFKPKQSAGPVGCISNQHVQHSTASDQHQHVSG